MNYLRKKRVRLREIEFEKIVEIQEVMKFNNVEMSELLGLHINIDKEGNKKGSAQYYNYRKSGKVPADKYYGARDSLLLDIEQEASQRRQQIMQLFS